VASLLDVVDWRVFGRAKSVLKTEAACVGVGMDWLKFHCVDNFQV
jgi:hypothetical protein